VKEGKGVKRKEQGAGSQSRILRDPCFAPTRSEYPVSSIQHPETSLL